MAQSNNASSSRGGNARLCRLCVWDNYRGLGFNLEKTATPPYLVRSVESLSPAAAGGLKFRDIILAINNEDVTEADYNHVTSTLKNAKDSDGRVELLVADKRTYEASLKNQDVSTIAHSAKIIDTPKVMPRDYINFPQHKPRTCEIRLSRADEPFGFEVANGEKETGAFIQDVMPNTPASRTDLRKCDRILEVDDQFVDDEPSASILKRLGDGKKKKIVKLYVVDTITYKYFQENNIPLQSKLYKKSPHAKLPSQPSFQPVEEYPSGESDTEVDRQGQHLDDIRLCTINRSIATVPYGFELVSGRTDTVHTLRIKPDVTSGISYAENAGIRTDDHLIEVNGQNVENTKIEQVKQYLRTGPNPLQLQLLVTDAETYNYYKQQGKPIHSRLPNIEKLPLNASRRPSSTAPSYHQNGSRRSTSTLPPRPGGLSSGIGQIADKNPIRPTRTEEESQLNRRQCLLRSIPTYDGYGFVIGQGSDGEMRHKITQIAANSPAEQQGLRVNDYVLSVDNQDVRDMSTSDFKQFLRDSLKDADRRGQPCLIEVYNDNPYGGEPMRPATPSGTSGRSSTIRSTTGRKPTDTDETYPEMRLCTIRSWSQFRDLGFQINQTPSRLGGSDGYRIQNLDRNSPAAHTNIYNGDYIIEVNRENIERKSYREVDNLIRDAYRTNQGVRLLVIDDTGYQWYKNRRYPIDTSAPKAYVTPHTTPDPPRTSSIGNTDNRETDGRYASISRPESSPPRKTQPSPDRPYTNGYIGHSLPRTREHLTRGAVDVVSAKRLLRFCRLTTKNGQSFGFKLTPDNKHTVYNIIPDSPAAQAGLNENDRLVEINDQNIENKTSQEVTGLLRNAAHDGVLRLFIAPNSVKPLIKRSAKSLPALHDENIYREPHSGSIYDDDDQSSLIKRYRSLSRLPDKQLNQYRTDTTDYSNVVSYEPINPLPRQCVLYQDKSFEGCGFRLNENALYDTPIVIEVYPNSPAKRSGISENDHIIYIEDHNVQNFRSFNHITNYIKHKFEQNGQITVVVLTDPGFQVLKRRGGYLENRVFDCQVRNSEEMKPRLYNLSLRNQDADFGFRAEGHNPPFIKSVEPGSLADISGIKKNDIIIELNGQNINNVSTNHINEIIDKSNQKGKIEILVIDINGYHYSMQHAIPLNSLLSFVEKHGNRNVRSDSRIQREPIYL